MIKNYVFSLLMLFVVNGIFGDDHTLASFIDCFWVRADHDLLQRTNWTRPRTRSTSWLTDAQIQLKSGSFLGSSRSEVFHLLMEIYIYVFL